MQYRQLGRTGLKISELCLGWARYANDRTWAVVDVLATKDRDDLVILAVAREVGKSPAQVALNWLLRQPGVTAPIVGARNLEQLNDNLGASGWSLTADQAKRLTEASAQPLPYPYETHARLAAS